MAAIDQEKMSRVVECGCEYCQGVGSPEGATEIRINENGHGPVIVDGHNITPYVVGFRVEAGIGKLTTITLELSTPVTITAAGLVAFLSPEEQKAGAR